MKKFLNVVGIILSSIMTIVLAVLIFSFVVILNVKAMLNPKGISEMLEKIDVASTIKEIDSGKVWSDIIKTSNDINLTEEQITEILNNENIKNQLSIYLDRIINSIFGNEKFELTTTELKKFVSDSISEINLTSTEKITDEEKEEILNSINDEFINSIVTSINSINITDDTFGALYKFVFDSIAYTLLLVIVFIISLIALFRLSYYKWMFYAGISTVAAMLLLLPIDLLFSALSISETITDLISPIRVMMISNIHISIVVLFVIAVVLFIAHHFLKKSREDTLQINEHIESF